MEEVKHSKITKMDTAFRPDTWTYTVFDLMLLIKFDSSSIKESKELIIKS